MPQFESVEVSKFYKLLSQRAEEIAVKVKPGRTLPELVMHVSEGCNLACTYCFADAGMYGNSTRVWMDPKEAREYIISISSRYENIDSIKFFGGEPLMNLPAIQSVIDTFAELHDAGKIMSLPCYGMVSNMTIYNQRVRDLIVDNNISITGSLDGPKEVNDLGRIYPNGRGTFDKISRTIRKMREETGQPRTLEVVYGPWHFIRGWTPKLIHEYLIDEFSAESVYIVPAFLAPDELKSYPQYTAQFRTLGYEYGRYIGSNVGDKSCRDETKSMLRVLSSSRYKGMFCPLGTDTLTVMSSGRLLPCYTLARTDQYDISADVRTLDGVSSRELKVIEAMNSTARTREGGCGECCLFDTCRGCPGGNFGFSGELSGRNAMSCDYLVGYHEGILESVLELQSSGKLSLLSNSSHA